MDKIVGADLITVVRLQCCRGSGTKDDPHGVVDSYWTMGGKLIKEMDERKEPCEECKALRESLNSFKNSDAFTEWLNGLAHS